MSSNMTDVSKKTRFLIDKRVFIFMFFLVLSTIFWFLLALSKPCTTYIEYPIKYTNPPKNKTLVGDAAIILRVQVTSLGFNILRYNLLEHLPLTIDIQSMKLKPQNKAVSSIKILSNFAKERLQKVLGNEFEIIKIEPDTICFQFEPVKYRKMKVQLNLNYSFENQYMLAGKVSFSPDSVTVQGPPSLIDTLSCINTRWLTVDNLNETKHTFVEFSNINYVKFVKVKGVKVTIPVEKYTEGTMSVPIEIIGCPRNKKLIPFPSEVKVSYLVGLERYNSIKASDFKAIVYYNEVKEDDKNAKLKVTMIQQPVNVNVTRFYPSNVEYIIENSK